MHSWDREVHRQFFLQHAVEIVGSSYCHVSPHDEFHLRAECSSCCFRSSFHEHVCLLLVPCCFGEEEVEAELVGLLCLEDIHVVAVGLAILHLSQDVAGVCYLPVEQRHVELASELTVFEVVLYECEVCFVEREAPSSEFASFSRQHVVSSEFERGSALVEEHIVCRYAETLVCAGSDFERLRE